jgi:3D (Asp-Asp-Asp) domain-containing protein
MFSSDATRINERLNLHLALVWIAIWIVVGGLLGLANHLDKLREQLQHQQAILDTRRPIEIPDVQVQVAPYQRVLITAYASLPEQTCGTSCTGPDDPFITATGNWVRPGTVAVSRDLLAGAFPYGTRLRLHSLQGGPGCGGVTMGDELAFLPEVWLVDDTMAARKRQQVDLWLPDNQLALRWGRCHGIVVPWVA